MVKLHDADRMSRRDIAVQDGAITICGPRKGWMWVTVIANGADDLSLTPDPGSMDFRRTLADGRHIWTWLVEASNTPVRLDGLHGENDTTCLFGTLPDPLDEWVTGSEAERHALAEMLGDISSETRPAQPRSDALSDTHNFDLARGGAAVARSLGFAEIQVDLLNAALAIRQSTNLTRLLSYAKANAYDYTGAIAAAKTALAAKPDLADGPFRAHLEELLAYCDLAGELRDIAAKRPRTPARGTTIAYCLHNAQPHAQGGYAMRSHALASAIVETGQPLIAFARPGFPSDGEASPDGTPDTEQVDEVRYRFENGFGRRGRAYGYIADAADYFEKTFAANEIGLVHAATNFWTGLPAAIAACRLGLPFVYEVRSFWSITRDARELGFSESLQGQRDDALETMVLAMADQVLTLNEAMRDRLVEMGVDADRITLAPNCVDADLFAPHAPDADLAAQFGVGPNDIVIGYMGAMLGYEGIDLLVDAAAPLIQDDERIRLLIVGADAAKRTQAGAIEYDLERQIERLSMAEHIRLVDRVPPETARNLYTLFDICAYPRRPLEVCELVSPLKPLEAMAMRKTVIGSSVRALQDVIDHERTGLIFDKGDVESLRAVLHRAIGDETLRARLGEAARDFVRTERNWAQIAEQVGTVYRQAEGEDARTAEKLRKLVDTHFDAPDDVSAIRTALGSAR
ncbi:glycosyltransferase family 4 protein [Parasphingopyxis sp.]|uniref:glycosyltransferase family 4 protein n=1 Tax=Parasphingopyxis sp. TaxID=1920299 RepID=UPI00262A7ABF|nr:glycosyltransferase family 4 protein [Parasphingopyxis sp.]